MHAESTTTINPLRADQVISCLYITERGDDEKRLSEGARDLTDYTSRSCVSIAR